MLLDEFRKLSVEDVVGALKEFIAAHKVDAVSSPGYTSAKRLLDDAMVFDARSSSILSMLAPSNGPEADSIGPGTLGKEQFGSVTASNKRMRLQITPTEETPAMTGCGSHAVRVDASGTNATARTQDGRQRLGPTRITPTKMRARRRLSSIENSARSPAAPAAGAKSTASTIDARLSASASALLFSHRSTQMQNLAIEKRIILLQYQLGNHLSYHGAPQVAGGAVDNDENGGQQWRTVGNTIASSHITRSILGELHGAFVALRDVCDQKGREIGALLCPPPTTG